MNFRERFEPLIGHFVLKYSFEWDTERKKRKEPLNRSRPRQVELRISSKRRIVKLPSGEFREGQFYTASRIMNTLPRRRRRYCVGRIYSGVYSRIVRSFRVNPPAGWILTATYTSVSVKQLSFKQI